MEYGYLIDEAKKALRFAYAPYSKYRVGAALLGKSGTVYTGCNIENASYGVSNCAERTALFKAVSEGEKAFTAIAVVAEGRAEGGISDAAGDNFSDAEKGGISDAPRPFPCGICRQALSEFSPDLFVIVEGKNGIESHRLQDLLPHAFHWKGEEENENV